MKNTVRNAVLGMSVSEIAAELGLSWDEARKVLMAARGADTAQADAAWAKAGAVDVREWLKARA